MTFEEWDEKRKAMVEGLKGEKLDIYKDWMLDLWVHAILPEGISELYLEKSLDVLRDRLRGR